MPVVAAYPSTIPTFTEKYDLVDVVFASHINTLQAEVAAIAATIGTSPQGVSATVKARIAAAESAVAALQAKYNGSGNLPMANVEGLAAELATLSATDSNSVHKTGNETIDGTKTFLDDVIAPNVPQRVTHGANSIFQFETNENPVKGQLIYDYEDDILWTVDKDNTTRVIWARNASAEVAYSSTTPTSGTTQKVIGNQAWPLGISAVVDVWFDWYNIVKTVATDVFLLYLYTQDAYPPYNYNLIDRRYLAQDSSVLVTGGGSFHRTITLTPDTPNIEWRLGRSSGTGTAFINLGGQYGYSMRRSV
jgi:hypothetical protein